MNGINAILVSVGFNDLLRITLPYNRHHFCKVMVVTSWDDTEAERIAIANSCLVYKTNAFYEDGAPFNKWRAMEEGLDVLGREGWMCVMDADILWPKVALANFNLEIGNMYTPFRKMLTNIIGLKEVPDEALWKNYPNHPQMVEFASYTEIFHAGDPVLHNLKDWYGRDWKHCGVADSFFQQRWLHRNKIRPPFSVLHLGMAGVNWCGRAEYTTDGIFTDPTGQRRHQLKEMIGRRRLGPRRWDEERIRKG